MDGFVPEGHLYIGICSNRSGPTWELSKALEFSSVHLFQNRWLVTKGRAGSSDIEDGRNQLFTHFVNNPQYTHALFLDDDVHWEESDAIWRLVNHPVDFVLGAYPKRAEGEGFPISMLDEPIEFVDPITREPDPKGLLRIAGGPGGLMRITRACAEKLVKADPENWYHQPCIPGTKKAWNMFEFTVKDHIRRSEDKHFCFKWRALGGDVWCDPHLMLHHYGNKTYSGCFAHYLQHVGLKRPGKVVKVDLVGAPEAPKTVHKANLKMAAS